MKTTRTAQLKVDASLLRRARRALKGSSDASVVTQALQEAIANREVEAAVKRLVRRGRGHFAGLEETDA